MADDSTSLPTIPEMVSGDLGSGVIATYSIVHATPASFYAHVPAQGQYEEIAAQLATSSVDFFQEAVLRSLLSEKTMQTT